MSERILVVSVGSRGDAQPYIALANKLMTAGHEVALVLNGIFESFVAENGPGATFYPLEGDPAAILQSEEFEDALHEGNLSEISKIMLETSKKFLNSNIDLVHKYVVEYKPTCLLCSIVNVGETLALGQKFLIPVIVASTIPAYPSEELPLIGLTDKPLPFGWLNKGAGKLLWKVQWLAIGGAIKELRRKLKLPPIDNTGMSYVPILNMYSTLVQPRPKDYPPQVIDTGYWILNPKDEFIPPQDIVEFLDAGTPPVYIGFGSMPVKHKQDILNMFSKCLEKTGNRGIYCGGWSNIDGIKVPENILVIKGAPHEWLFPRCAMAFHHGGAGTTAASLRAGIPTIILSVLIDQPFWSQRIVQLGVGQDHVCPLKDVTESYLLHQMEHCQKERIKNKAKELGEKLKKEDGTFEAASYIVSYAQKNRNPGIEQLNYLPDSSTSCCMDCKTEFTLLNRRHHCMSCGSIFCSKCVKYFDLPNYPTFRYCCRGCAKLHSWDFDAQP